MHRFPAWLHGGFSEVFIGFLTVVDRPWTMRRLGNNLSGQYKRAVGMALHIGIGNFGGAIGANIFRQQDAPRYIPGSASWLPLIQGVSLLTDDSSDAIELMYIGISYILIPITVVLYKRINAKRDADMAAGTVPKYTEAELRELGDRAPDFRYTL